jgi:photosystem II stability/assembly factor-like uncharacterized protein
MSNPTKQMLMKKLFLSFCFFVIGVHAFTQWTWQNPLPQGNCLNSVRFIDVNTGYAVGNNGTILKTTDAGTTWSTVSSGTTYNLNSVCFPTPDIGYIVGAESYFGIVMKTTDFTFCLLY